MDGLFPRKKRHPKETQRAKTTREHTGAVKRKMERTKKKKKKRKTIAPSISASFTRKCQPEKSAEKRGKEKNRGKGLQVELHWR